MIPTRRTVDAEELESWIDKQIQEIESLTCFTLSQQQESEILLVKMSIIRDKITSLSTPPIEASAGSMTVGQAKDEVAKKAGGENWKELMSRTNIQDSDVEQVAELYASSQSKRIEELEKDLEKWQGESELWYQQAHKLQSELSDSRKEPIEFAEWLRKENYAPIGTNDDNSLWSRGQSPEGDTQRIYHIFLDSKQKQ